MTQELEEALAQVEEIIDSWIHPKPRPEYPEEEYVTFGQPLILLGLGARCGAIEWVVPHGTKQIKIRIGRPDGECVEKIYEFDRAMGALRNILARFSVLTSELANPEITSMHFEDNTWDGAAEKSKYYKNNLYGFELTFDFTDEFGTTALTVETYNGACMPTRGLEGYGFRITAV